MVLAHSPISVSLLQLARIGTTYLPKFLSRSRLTLALGAREVHIAGTGFPGFMRYIPRSHVRRRCFVAGLGHALAA